MTKYNLLISCKKNNQLCYFGLTTKNQPNKESNTNSNECFYYFILMFIENNFSVQYRTKSGGNFILYG